MRQKNYKWSAILSILTALPVVALAEPSDPVGGTAPGGGHPWIWVRFDNRDDAPIEDTHFQFNYSDADAPGVALLVGQDISGLLGWRVWCTVSEIDLSPAPIGGIATPGEFDYSLTLLNGADDPGATDLGSAVLTPSGDHHSSIVGSSIISGNLAGDITVQQYTSNGGALSLLIAGDVGSGSTITAGGLVELTIGDGTYADGTLAGRLLLVNGLPSPGFVKLGTLAEGAEIDLNHEDVTGQLVLYDDVVGDVVNGGAIGVYGEVNLSVGSAEFSGTATFESLGGVALVGSAVLTGTLHFTGDVFGFIGISAMDGHGRVIIDGSLAYLGQEEEFPLISMNSMGDDAAVCVDYDGWDDNQGFKFGAGVQVGLATYYHNSPGAADHVWEPTECKGDMDNDGSINLLDVDGFVAAVVNDGSYGDLFPGLEGSALYHGDITLDGSLNLFDIDPFATAVTNGCCTCSPFSSPTAEQVAAMFGENVDPSRLPGLVDILIQLPGQFWEDVVALLQAP